MSENNPIEIWLIDDDDGHALLVEESFQDAGLRNGFVRAREGSEGLMWLQDVEAGRRPRPGLVLLDISMPGVDGFEILEGIKASQTLKSIPVIMLTSTDHPREIQRSYNLGANAYIVKPVGVPALMTAINHAVLFVLEIVRVSR